MATPCSVKAKGSLLLPPQAVFNFWPVLSRNLEITICDVKSLSMLHSKM